MSSTEKLKIIHQYIEMGNETKKLIFLNLNWHCLAEYMSVKCKYKPLYNLKIMLLNKIITEWYRRAEIQNIADITSDVLLEKARTAMKCLGIKTFDLTEKWIESILEGHKRPTQTPNKHGMSLNLPVILDDVLASEGISMNCLKLDYESHKVVLLNYVIIEWFRRTKRPASLTFLKSMEPLVREKAMQYLNIRAFNPPVSWINNIYKSCVGMENKKVASPLSSLNLRQTIKDILEREGITKEIAFDKYGMRVYLEQDSVNAGKNLSNLVNPDMMEMLAKMEDEEIFESLDVNYDDDTVRIEDDNNVVQATLDNTDAKLQHDSEVKADDGDNSEMNKEPHYDDPPAELLALLKEEDDDDDLDDIPVTSEIQIHKAVVKQEPDIEDLQISNLNVEPSLSIPVNAIGTEMEHSTDTATPTNLAKKGNQIAQNLDNHSIPQQLINPDIHEDTNLINHDTATPKLETLQPEDEASPNYKELYELLCNFESEDEVETKSTIPNIKNEPSDDQHLEDSPSTLYQDHSAKRKCSGSETLPLDPKHIKVENPLPVRADVYDHTSSLREFLSKHGHTQGLMLVSQLESAFAKSTS